MKNFIRMERWIADAPDQAGEVIRQFINDLYRDNKLVKGELVVGGEKVDLKKIDMPLLNIYAEKDTLVPNAATIPLNDLISSKDKEYFSLPVGHIGMYTSSKSQSALAPKIAEWLKSRSKK
jgi:polyhydroxyalkanoate synthase